MSVKRLRSGNNLGKFLNHVISKRWLSKLHLVFAKGELLQQKSTEHFSQASVF